MKHNPLKAALALCCFLAGQVQAQSPAISVDKLAVAKASEVNLAGQNINIGGNVFAPFRYGEKVYFTASVPNKQGTGTVSRLYSAVGKEPATLQRINPKEDDMNAAYATLNLAATRIYYTVFKSPRSVEIGQSEIWYRDKDYEGTWGHVVLMPKNINMPGFITTQPTCGFDFTLKKEVVYFSSNRPGGKGGFDIWYVTVERDGSFGNPINLPCNTAADEVTPHFYTHSQMFFFSSNRSGGMGGFDVYRCEKNKTGAWEQPENLTSANTTFDELYFTYHQPSHTSYFCSNRPIEKSKNPTTVNSDFLVYSAHLNGSLIVDTRNASDSANLYGCNIELEDTSTGTIDLTILRSEESQVELPLLPDKKYRLIVSRPGYFPIFLPLEFMATDFAHPVRKTVYLRPMR